LPPTGEQTAPFGEGDLAIRRHGEAWRATQTVGKAETVLADGFYPACYRACRALAEAGAK
jgi:hypothetical protein